jgi:hypothetical protein
MDSAWALKMLLAEPYLSPVDRDWLALRRWIETDTCPAPGVPEIAAVIPTSKSARLLARHTLARPK